MQLVVQLACPSVRLFLLQLLKQQTSDSDFCMCISHDRNTPVLKVEVIGEGVTIRVRVGVNKDGNAVGLTSVLGRGQTELVLYSLMLSFLILAASVQTSRAV